MCIRDSGREGAGDLELATIAGTAVHVPQLKRAGHSGGRGNGRLGRIACWLDDATDSSDLADPAHWSISWHVGLVAFIGLEVFISGPLVPRRGRATDEYLQPD